MAPISAFIIFCLIITFGYFVGLLTFITDHKENKCEMTHMFEYPQFVRINVKADPQYKKYGLYAYSEGRFTYRARQMRFDGIPVLFIPGNAGSHRQVRSFASVALRKSLDSRPGFHFDFFTIDLNNELSGLNGALLYEQMQYVNHSIARILERYDDDWRYPTKSVVLIGHSMGGIIARGLLASLPKNSNLLPFIITLATPHLRAAMTLDNYMSDFYHKMQKSTLPENTTVISVSGGYNDFIISPFITNARDFKNFHVATTCVPLALLPVDHLCILWCKQLVLAITRGLFDLVNLNTKQISLDPEYHQTVFHHHLVQNSGTKVRKAFYYQQPISFNKIQDEWIENLQRQYSISLLNGVKQTQWHMIRLIDEPDHEYLTVLALNLEVTDWAFVCSAVHLREQARICSDGFHLSQHSEIAPSVKYKRRVLRLNMHELKKNFTHTTHVVMRVLPTREPVVLHVDRYGGDERKIEVNLPRWWSFDRQSIMEETLDKVLHYELVLPQLQHVIQSYKLYVDPIKCTHNMHHASVSLIVPWANHDVHNYVTETERDQLHVRLYNSRPASLNNSAVVRLTLDPTCRYSISIRNSFVGMLGQIARTYSPMLIANMVAVVLLSFRNQLVSIDETGTCSLFFTAIKNGIKPYYILTMVKLASRGLSWRGFSRILPVPDWQLIAEEGNDFFLLPLLLYMCSVGIMWMAALGLASSLILCESTFHKVATKFLARTVTGAIKFSDWLIGGFHKLPGIVAAILILLSISTCGSLALCLGCGFYFLKLTQMSQDYVEGLVLRIAKYFAKKFARKILPRRTNANRDSSQNRITTNMEELADRALTRAEVEALLRSEQETKSENEITEDENKKETESKEDEEEDGKIKQIASKDDKKNKDDIEPMPGCSSGDFQAVTKSTEKSGENQETETEPNNTENSENTREEPAEHSSIFFHFSIFLLWCIVAGLSVPSALTWAHNFKYSSTLQPDPSFLPGIVLSICAFPLWHMELPKANICGYKELGQVFNIMAAASLIYAPLSIYRLTYIITGIIVLITLHQLLAPARPDTSDDITQESTSESPITPDPVSMFDRVKSKWE